MRKGLSPNSRVFDADEAYANNLISRKERDAAIRRFNKWDAKRKKKKNPSIKKPKILERSKVPMTTPFGGDWVRYKIGGKEVIETLATYNEKYGSKEKSMRRTKKKVCPYCGITYKGREHDRVSCKDSNGRDFGRNPKKKTTSKAAEIKHLKTLFALGKLSMKDYAEMMKPLRKKNPSRAIVRKAVKLGFGAEAGSVNRKLAHSLNVLKKKKTGKKRPINLAAIAGAIASPKTPKHLKAGLIRKYGAQLKRRSK